MSPHFLDGGLAVPATAVVTDERHRFEGRIGGVKERIAMGSGLVAGAHPPDRNPPVAGLEPMNP